VPASKISIVKHKGKAKAAFRRMMIRALGIYWVLGLLLIAINRYLVPGLLIPGVISLTGLLLGFALFAGYFFRDPDAQVPAGNGLIVSPGHGTVDVIDETDEPSVMGGRCRRVSIFLSVFNVHVQQAPVAGAVTLVRHTAGQFLNALKLESAALNENVLIGFQTSEPACGPVAIKLITGLIARRIVPWVQVGDTVAKGERVSLIQFGSRVDIYLPLQSQITVALGDRVVGGETVVARIVS
jgi:phosphatidylserine decarboxylase